MLVDLVLVVSVVLSLPINAHLSELWVFLLLLFPVCQVLGRCSIHHEEVTRPRTAYSWLRIWEPKLGSVCSPEELQLPLHFQLPKAAFDSRELTSRWKAAWVLRITQITQSKNTANLLQKVLFCLGGGGGKGRCLLWGWLLVLNKTPSFPELQMGITSQTKPCSRQMLRDTGWGLISPLQTSFQVPKCIKLQHQNNTEIHTLFMNWLLF